MLDEDVARLSPLKHANLTVLGRYRFRTSTPAGGLLRPVRDPAEADADADADETIEGCPGAPRPVRPPLASGSDGRLAGKIGCMANVDFAGSCSCRG